MKQGYTISYREINSHKEVSIWYASQFEAEEFFGEMLHKASFIKMYQHETGLIIRDFS